MAGDEKIAEMNLHSFYKESVLWSAMTYRFLPILVYKAKTRKSHLKFAQPNENSRTEPANTCKTL